MVPLVAGPVFKEVADKFYAFNIDLSRLYSPSVERQYPFMHGADGSRFSESYSDR